MFDFVRFVEAFCLFAAALHLTTIAVVGVRALRARPKAGPAGAPGVSVVRPVCGLENHIEATLRSTFEIDYPSYEIIFCVAFERDPVVPLVRALIAEYPDAKATLLVGDDPISINPKLNNLVKGWAAATHDWVAMTDSNVLLPRDYLQQMLARADERTAVVSAPPLGSAPQGVWAELECAFLNAYQARWQLAADAVGLGFVHGKNMLWRRKVLDAAGGLRALAAEAAEDAAGTKIARAAGMKARLVPRPFPQPLGDRSFSEVWNRQVRWARLRRASFKGFFLPEISSGGFLPMIGIAWLVHVGAVPLGAALASLALWYGAEIALARALGWPVSPRAPFLAFLRDWMLPCFWVSAMLGNEFVWRGTHMNIARPDDPSGAIRLADSPETERA